MLRFRLAALAMPLAAALAICPHVAQAQSMGGGGTLVDNSHLTTLDPYPPERGWQWLSKAMDKLRPGVDTRLPPTPSQITDHIEARIDKGDYAGALKLIKWRQAQLQGKPGTDVQLMFQHARVLAALGRTDQAAAIYKDMTQRFPELPEPWNNLATLYVQQGKLDQAGAALRTALQVDPGYADAQANLKQLAARDPDAARVHMTEAPAQ
jgi:tetratricopeptide (TPR) repeat protein